MRKPRYKTLQDFMERTGTSSTRLLALVKTRTGKSISPGMLSMILRGSCRCSLQNAWPLHIVTGVPMDELTRWPRYVENEKPQSVA